MTPLSVAVQRGQYELAALRLLLGVVAAAERLEEAASIARSDLLALLAAGDA